jgi:hypothetical protein
LPEAEREKGSLPQDESCLPHFSSKGGNVGLDTIIHRYSSKELMNYWKRSICSRDIATNLSHDCQECDRSDIGTLAAHIAAGDDLESSLLRCIYIVGNELLLVCL